MLYHTGVDVLPQPWWSTRGRNTAQARPFLLVCWARILFFWVFSCRRNHRSGWDLHNVPHRVRQDTFAFATWGFVSCCWLAWKAISWTIARCSLYHSGPSLNPHWIAFYSFCFCCSLFCKLNVRRSMAYKGFTEASHLFFTFLYQRSPRGSGHTRRSGMPLLMRFSTDLLLFIS